MYWPIGAPKTYAASKHVIAARSTRLVASNDGLDTTGGTKQDDGPLDTGAEEKQSSLHGQGSPAESSPGSGSSGSQDIVDVKIARGGHIFASITDSSLTVWQTKVGPS